MPNSLFPSFPVARVMLAVSQNSRRAVMQVLAKQISTDLNLHAAGVADMLAHHNGANMAAIGKGVVVIDQCVDYIDEPYMLMARLTHRVDFNAPDGQMIDVVCLLLSPAGHKIDHIRSIGRLTRMFRDDSFNAKLRSSTSEDAIRALFMAPLHEAIAA